MNLARKIICTLLCVSCLLSSASLAFADETQKTTETEAITEIAETEESVEIPETPDANAPIEISETNEATEVAEVAEIPQTTQNQISLTSHLPKEAATGETISAEFVFDNVGEEIKDACVYFTINGERLIDYTTTGYTIATGKSATLYWEAKAEYLGTNVVIGFCAEKYGEKLCYKEETVSVVSPEQKINYDYNIDFFYLPSVVEAGDVLVSEVVCRNRGDEFGAVAYFTVDGKRLVDYTFTDYWAREDKRSTLYWQVPNEYIDKAVSIGFYLEKNGEIIYKTEKNVNVIPDFNYKCTFTHLPKEISPGEVLTAEVTCSDVASEFGATAYFTFNGKRVTDYTFTGFWVRNGRIVNYYWVPTNDYLNKEVTIGFCLERRGIVIHKTEQKVSVIPYSKKATAQDVLKKVNPVNVEAWVRYTTSTYSDLGLSTKNGTVAGGTKVICISSKSGYSNQVRLPNGKVCWLPLSALNISTKNYTNPVDLTKEEKELYVNAKGYTSSTNFLIFINLERQKTNVFSKKNGRWVLERSFSCATGTNANPTCTGTFKYYARQTSWNYNTYYVGPILIFNGNYAMHSVLMRYNGTIYDGTVGRPASHGCVRLLPNDINWIAKYVPMGTTVVIV